MKKPDPATLGALAAGLGAFTLYVLTLAPSTAFWDTSEYIATAHIVGIPHPPGNPLFVFVGKVWSLLLAPTGLSVAVRINLLAATTSAIGTAFFYLVAHRLLSTFERERWFALVGAGASALLGATAFTVWNQSNVNEKVYTISVMIIAVVSWLAVRWYDRRDEAGSERYALTAIFMLALGSTNHLMSVLPLPALVVLVLIARPGRLLKPAFLSRAVLLGIIGLSFNFVLPIRAGLDPVVNEGDPTCSSVGSAAVAIYTHGRSGCEALGATLTREQYQTPPVTERKAPFGAQIATYLQYFEWQWARGIDPSELPAPARLPFTILFLALGAMGLYTAFRADRALFAYLATLTATLTLGLVVYLNFKHGFSLHAELPQAEREVRERDYFFVAGFMLWGSLAGVGLSWLWETVTRGLGGSTSAMAKASPVLLIACIPLVLNWSWAARNDDYAARDWAYGLLTSVGPYGVLFTNGDNDTFPLWYLQEVEGIRRDVTVIVGQYLFTDWYLEQLQAATRPENQQPYDGTLFPGLHDPPPIPSRSITQLTPEVMAGVGTVRLQQDMTVAFPQLAVTYPEGMVLDRGQQLALNIINDSYAERPIHFSSSGGMMSGLGLAPWGVRHGLTTKLELRNLDTDPNEGWVQTTPEFGGDWFDLEQSLKLYDEVFQFRGLRDRQVWADRTTTMMPMQYYVLAIQLSDAVRASGGDPALVARLQADAAAFQVVGMGGSRGAVGAGG